MCIYTQIYEFFQLKSRVAAGGDEIIQTFEIEQVIADTKWIYATVKIRCYLISSAGTYKLKEIQIWLIREMLNKSESYYVKLDILSENQISTNLRLIEITSSFVKVVISNESERDLMRYQSQILP